MRELRTQGTRLSYEASPGSEGEPFTVMGEGFVTIATQLTLWPMDSIHDEDTPSYPGAGFGEVLNPGVQVLIHPDLPAYEALMYLEQLAQLIARDHEDLRAIYERTPWHHEPTRGRMGTAAYRRTLELRAALAQR